MSRIYLSLGSNQSPGRHLRAAVAALQEHFAAVQVSPAYRSAAVGFDGHPFINLAVSLETTLSPLELKAWLYALEDREGRRRDQPRFSNRTLDIDIVFVDQQIIDADGLRIPRPEWRQPFVLKPMLDLAPTFVEPLSGQTLAQLWRHHQPPDGTLQAVDLSILE
ncbi:2-amino-4-hydroxy-6-hydroxymethyldihydropteridine diphosphokinase [Frateuria aurantia]